MVGRQVAVAAAMVAGANLVVLVALPAPYLGAWAWAPWLMVGVEAVVTLACLALAITPDQLRDTRASVYPYRSGLSLVNVEDRPDAAPLADLPVRPAVGLLVVQVRARGDGARALGAAPGPGDRTDGLPPVVEGSTEEGP